MKNTHPQRIHILKNMPATFGAIIYWMSRDQRIQDNWALLYAQELAFERKEPLVVVFCLVPTFLDATFIPFSFMIENLKEIENALQKLNITFFLMIGQPEREIPEFIKQIKAGALITDFDPLRIKKQWKEFIATKISIPFYEVDTHNIVPCRIASSKCEFGAYTIRPKIHRLLPEFLCEIPKIKKHPFIKKAIPQRNNWEQAFKSLKVDNKIAEISAIKSTEKEALKTLKIFIKNKLNSYDKKRNDPNIDGTSNLSPYLHFGQISAQRIALEIEKSHVNVEAKDAFLEELIVRRELSDNFCFYNPDYDNFNGFPNWAKMTLNAHRKDKRQYLYTQEQFEKAQTHDDLWNAAQKQMVITGKMHGFMRMYWAKKILEWSTSPEEALNIAIYLNDKYQLDGRDPNGYTGIAWSIGGVHDRAWGERAVFGKIRYMSYNGCKSKFDIKSYIKTYPA